MKKIYLTAVAGFLSTIALAQSLPVQYTLKGQIKDIGEPGKVVLTYFANGKRNGDTAILDKGRFAFSGTMPAPMQVMLLVLKSSDNPNMMISMGYAGEIYGKDGRQLYIDKGNITLTGDSIKTAVIAGSAAQVEFEELQEKRKPIADKLAALNEAMGKLASNRESEEYKNAYSTLIKTMKEFGPVEAAFIRSHPDSYVSWNLLTGKSIISDAKAFQAQYNSMNARFRNSEEGKKVQEKIAKAFRTAMGSVAPDFSQNDAEGKAISLASLRGKYVLIDFWASWCGPCRAENPHVRSAYEKFKGKNFEILAVSLDNKKDAWLKAIADDGLPWLHVSDLQGWKNAVAELYDVKAVPQNWLLDPNGVIIGANMRGKELEEKLGAVLK